MVSGGVSIHAARAGGDPGRWAARPTVYRFNPRRPRGRRQLCCRTQKGSICFNPRRPRGRRLECVNHDALPSDVSIHAARAGGDMTSAAGSSTFRCFNPRRPRGRRRKDGFHVPEDADVSIHAARAGGDAVSVYNTGPGAMFQSTPPARAATVVAPARNKAWPDCFNPRRPRGRRLDEPDDFRARSGCFNPRRPRGRRLPVMRYVAAQDDVSIHAARAGGDRSSRPGRRRRACFNPRRPRGRRQWRLECAGRRRAAFQSTPPARAATRQMEHWPPISTGFNPRRPRGRRRGHIPATATRPWVSIHAARAGGDGLPSTY